MPEVTARSVYGTVPPEVYPQLAVVGLMVSTLLVITVNETVIVKVVVP